MYAWGRSLSVGASKSLEVTSMADSGPEAECLADVYLSLTGLDLDLLGFRLGQLHSAGRGKDHPLTKLCEVRGHSG